MDTFYVYFPATNTWRKFDGMNEETVKTLAAEFGNYQFRTEAEFKAANKSIV